MVARLLLLVAVAVAVPLTEVTPESAVTFIELPSPHVGPLLKDNPNVEWMPVVPTRSPSSELANLLQEDEGGVSLDVSSPSAITCGDNGCSCKHQYYEKHLDTNGCEVFVPQQYHSADWKCQYFTQGGYIFLYGNTWKKANLPSSGALAMDGDTYFCADEE